LDRYEYKLKLGEIETLAAEKNYAAAAEIADSINWRKVRNVNSLMLVGEVYQQTGRYEDSKELLLMAYDRSPIGKKIIYRLAEIAISAGQFEEAQEYYDEYYKLMSESREKLQLQEIDLNNLKKIDSTFEITGSTRPISTIAWYLTLLKIKNKFNSNSIKFPIVFDSPNNAELDNENIARIFKYILNNVNSDSQIIISTIEFQRELYPEFDIKNIITLNNEPYKLLNEDDYIKNIELYKKIMDM